MRTALEDLVQRADPGLQLPASRMAQTGQRLRQHIAVLKRVAARTTGVRKVLQKAGRRAVNGTIPLQKRTGHRTGPQT